MKLLLLFMLAFLGSAFADELCYDGMQLVNQDSKLMCLDAESNQLFPLMSHKPKPVEKMSHKPVAKSTSQSVYDFFQYIDTAICLDTDVTERVSRNFQGAAIGKSAVYVKGKCAKKKKYGLFMYYVDGVPFMKIKFNGDVPKKVVCLYPKNVKSFYSSYCIDAYFSEISK